MTYVEYNPFKVALELLNEWVSLANNLNRESPDIHLLDRFWELTHRLVTAIEAAELNLCLKWTSPDPFTNYSARLIAFCDPSKPHGIIGTEDEFHYISLQADKARDLCFNCLRIYDAQHEAMAKLERAKAPLPERGFDDWMRLAELLDMKDLDDKRLGDIVHEAEKFAEKERWRNRILLDEQNVAGSYHRQIEAPKKRIQNGHSPHVQAPHGTRGRRSDPKKRKHANRANDLRTNGKTWKETASGVNSTFRLKHSHTYDHESIRSLWRHFFDVKPKKKRQ